MARTFVEMYLEQYGQDQLQYIRGLTKLCNKASAEGGWWTNIDTGEDIEVTPEVFGMKVSLIHSEISEALEAFRKDLEDDKLPHRSGVEVELADAIIRILDLAGQMELDVAGAILEKIEYNTSRKDHKLEARKGSNGKKF